MGVSEKVAYLKGLMEGMKLDMESDNGKLFQAIADVLDEIALEIEDLTDEVTEVGDGLDVLSDDLADVEEVVFDEDDDDEDDDDEDDDDDDDTPLYATTCPECEKEIFFDEDDVRDDTIFCPRCGAKLEFDASELNDEEDD